MVVMAYVAAHLGLAHSRKHQLPMLREGSTGLPMVMPDRDCIADSGDRILRA